MDLKQEDRLSCELTTVLTCENNSSFLLILYIALLLANDYLMISSTPDVEAGNKKSLSESKKSLSESKKSLSESKKSLNESKRSIKEASKADIEIEERKSMKMKSFHAKLFLGENTLAFVGECLSLIFNPKVSSQLTYIFSISDEIL